EVTSLEDLDRNHIEGFLVWNRTRTWRGQRAASGAGRIISKAVIQSTVLSVRNLLDDITEWGWEQAPPRRLVFAVDVPKLDQPLPRALPPDIDVAVMNAVSGLDDSFARRADRAPRSWSAGRGATRPRTWQRHRLRSRRHLVDGSVGQARHRTHGPALGRHHRRVGRVDHRAWYLPAAAAPPHRSVDRFPVRRARSPSQPDPAAQRTDRCRRDLRTAWGRGCAVGGDPASAAAYVGYRTRERRDEPAGVDGVARARHPANDFALRHFGFTDVA